MRLIDAYDRLCQMRTAFFRVEDAAAWLGVSKPHASTILRRLRDAGRLVQLARGRFADPSRFDRDALARALAEPEPVYLSLETALYRHGMIEQIPDALYAMTSGPTRRVDTPLGAVSFHRLAPTTFGGADIEEVQPFVWMAHPEQALADVLYLRQSKSGRFAALPEVELPKRFNMKKARAAIARIGSPSRRSFVEAELERELRRARAHADRGDDWMEVG